MQQSQVAAPSNNQYNSRRQTATLAIASHIGLEKGKGEFGLKPNFMTFHSLSCKCFEPTKGMVL